MQVITQYLIAHPLVAAGLSILFVLSIHNVLRRQPRVAMGLWVLIFVVVFYVYMQASNEVPVDAEIVEPLPAG